jgi:CRISPR-associated endoribonuclease Cas6
LVGTLHKWLDEENELHGDLSLYSFSWLKGIEKSNNGFLECRNGATWSISAHDKTPIKKIMSGIMDDPKVCFGMSVREVILQETPEFTSTERFVVGSPVLLKRRIEGRKQQKHYSFNEPETNELLTQVLKKKLLTANLNDENVKVYFDKSFINAKTKTVHYKNIKNNANICPVIIEGSPEQIAFAWNVGVGHSTGIGFGFLN